MVDLKEGGSPNKEEPPKKGFGAKMQDQWRTFKEHDRLGDIVEYTKNNKRDTIAFALLAVGLILLFLEPDYGSLLIGVVASIYFANELWNWVNYLSHRSYRHGTAKLIVVGVTLFTIFLQAPAIVIGFLIGGLLQKLLILDDLSR